MSKLLAGNSKTDNLILRYRYEEKKVFEGFSCFDLDHTIIRPSSGKVFPKDKNDWELMKNVSKVLNEFNNKNWLTVIFTNQSGLKSSKKLTVDDFDDKLKAIATALDINIMFISSLNKDYYRKPMPGMWEIINKRFPYLKDKGHFYCGDAFNPFDKLKASDLKFAMNIKCPFIYPSELFVDNFKFSDLFNILKTSQDKTLQIVPKFYKFTVIDKNLYSKTINDLGIFLAKYKYIFVVSPPSSGKSSFCRNELSDYVRLSKDDYNSVVNYKKAIVKNINEKNKIVFDSTNHKNSSRKTLIDLLETNGVDSNEIGFIIREINKEDSMFLNKYRCYTTKGEVGILPDVAIHSYYKYLEEPHNNYIKIGHTIEKLETSNLHL